MPYGLRANNWVANPKRQPLPAEDPKLGGLTVKRKVELPTSQWMRELQHCSAMPSTTSEERQSRDRRLFLVHTAYVDNCTVDAAAAVHDAFGVAERESLAQGISSSQLGSSMSAFKPASVDNLVQSSMKASSLNAVLKGLGNSENSVAADTMSLGQVTIHFAGRDAVFNPFSSHKVRRSLLVPLLPPPPSPPPPPPLPSSLVKEGFDSRATETSKGHMHTYYMHSYYHCYCIP